MCLQCSCALFTHFIDVLFNLSFYSERPHDLLARTVQVVPSSCLSASWGVSVSSVNLKHTYTWPWPGEQLLWLPSCCSVCNSGLQGGEWPEDYSRYRKVFFRQQAAGRQCGSPMSYGLLVHLYTEPWLVGLHGSGPPQVGHYPVLPSTPSLQQVDFSPWCLIPHQGAPSPRGSCTLIWKE